MSLKSFLFLCAPSQHRSHVCVQLRRVELEKRIQKRAWCYGAYGVLGSMPGTGTNSEQNSPMGLTIGPRLNSNKALKLLAGCLCTLSTVPKTGAKRGASLSLETQLSRLSSREFTQPALQSCLIPVSVTQFTWFLKWPNILDAYLLAVSFLNLATCIYVDIMHRAHLKGTDVCNPVPGFNTDVDSI